MMSQAPGERSWLGLDGKVCVVTGAGSGIGAAIARQLASEGARVALLDKNFESARAVASRICQSGGEAFAWACDTSIEAEVSATAQQVLGQLGPCYGLANNAGFLRAGPLDQVSVADWNAVLSVNLTGYLLCGRAFAAQMRTHGGGSIVHIASIAANFPQTNSGSYSASKAGVLLLSRQMSVEWGADRIRSNAICPGMIRTALSAKFYEEPGFEARRAALTASRRIGEPGDIADAALFLLSPRSSYVNGAELAVDGAMPAMLMDFVPRPGFNESGFNESGFNASAFDATGTSGAGR
jgi:glucose 1-dehydrogenase